MFDASSLLNLVASGNLKSILTAWAPRFLVPERVISEVRFVLRGGVGADSHEREAVDLSPFLTEGLLVAITLTTHEEMARFVEFASSLDDGEAEACAAALVHGGELISDDLKARNVFAEMASQLGSHTTSELVRHWAESTQAPLAEVRATLLRIQERATFRPGRSDPHTQWWENCVQSS